MKRDTKWGYAPALIDEFNKLPTAEKVVAVAAPIPYGIYKGLEAAAETVIEKVRSHRTGSKPKKAIGKTEANAA